MTLTDDFNVQWDRVRGMFGLLPYRITVHVGSDDAQFWTDANGQFHVQLSATYEATPPLTKDHRYIHEAMHILDQMLRRMGMTQNYIYTRTHAFRFKGLPGTPPTWQDAEKGANNEWYLLPVERFAELGVIAVMGYVERERTYDYQVPIDPLAARRFLLDLVHEVSPVIYPTLYGGQPIARSADDSLLLYHRPSDNSIVAFDGNLSQLGATKKWW